MTSSRRYGSDVVVDALMALGIEHVAFNPGASFRGLHDSLVNRADGPELILCPHEKIAVNLAHGYAKVTGRPMAAIVHDVVGLLHASLGLFYAYTDRCPLLVLGGSGPMDAARRRPEIDWIHTANVQGNVVRDYVKWDDQPGSIEALPASLQRAYRVATLEPAGPVYVAIDADLQERPTDVVGSLQDSSRNAPRMTASASLVEEVAVRLVEARAPVIVTGYVGRDEASFELVPALAEAVGAGMVDLGIRSSIPNGHALDVTDTTALDEADLILFLDVKDRSRPLYRTDARTRSSIRRAPEATLIDIGFGDLHAASWVQHQGAAVAADLEVLGDATAILPSLVDRCVALVDRDEEGRRHERATRRDHLRALHEDARSNWLERARADGGRAPIAPSWLALEVAAALDGQDWVLSAGTLDDWTRRTWDLDRPYRHPGKSLGTATQIGITLGVALAHRRRGRVVVDLQPDGDLLYDPAALWVASANRLPLLIVMFNNRAYYNDWNHQALVAETRGSPRVRVPIGVRIDDPAVDFAGLARSFGWWAEGPVEDPRSVRDSIRRAVDIVTGEQRPALVDVVCAHR